MWYNIYAVMKGMTASILKKDIIKTKYRGAKK